MDDSVDVVLDFLRNNRFKKAEAALRTELGIHSNCDDSLEKNVRKQKIEIEEETKPAAGSTYQDAGTQVNNVSREVIVKDMQAGRTKKGDTKSNLYPWSCNPIYVNSDFNLDDAGAITNSLSELMTAEKHFPRWNSIGVKPEVSSDQSRTFLDSDEISDSRNRTMENPWSKDEELLNECSVKTVFLLNGNDASTSYNNCVGKGDGKSEKKKKIENNGTGVTAEDQVDDVSLSYISEKNSRKIEMPFYIDSNREGFPMLRPVKLKTMDKIINMNWEEKNGIHGSGKQSSTDNSYFIGSFLDVPVGQDISSSGGKRTARSSWLSVSRGISDDTSNMVSGFATFNDDSEDCFPNEFWDSDEYDENDDVGYMRQPIEDETWFLAHEIDYPSDNEKCTNSGVSTHQPQIPVKGEDDDESSIEEDSYLFGEQYLLGKNIQQLDASVEKNIATHNDSQLLDDVELDLMCSEPVWQGFVAENNKLSLMGSGKGEMPRRDNLVVDEDYHESVRSVGVGISNDAADFSSSSSSSSEGDVEYFHGRGVTLNGSIDKKKVIHTSDKSILTHDKNYTDANFSFPPPRSKGSKSDVNYEQAKSVNSEEVLARRHNDSSRIRSSGEEKASDVAKSRSVSASSSINYNYAELVQKADNVTETDLGTNLEDEEAVALQEQVSQIKAQEEEYEIFNLKIMHRKNRTGFEEDKNFHVVLNSVIAGRYHVTEHLGSAAFSKAIQAHDLHTGMDVCVKIIKNNKDFFDQSLDEIKLLKYINKHDPGDKYHLLRLYDYFYYREHLLIVSELLKANLYEFHKFNRESGGEVYFTMPRLQSITIQCLEALDFLHGLGLIHCDLKPENILVKSYSRCEIKVIDFGSSCFQTDHLCSYVQSRSYRAPEVLMGLPYDTKIDIWSLGCILAELCSGQVLFQNDSSATLLARVMGIIGPIDQAMLAKGQDTYKYFTKNHMIYERNQETNRLEYLIPKKSSLKHRLPMGDQGFINFVAHILEVNPNKRPNASEALKHPWLSYPYDPVSS